MCHEIHHIILFSMYSRCKKSTSSTSVLYPSPLCLAGSGFSFLATERLSVQCLTHIRRHTHNKDDSCEARQDNECTHITTLSTAGLNNQQIETNYMWKLKVMFRKYIDICSWHRMQASLCVL